MAAKNRGSVNGGESDSEDDELAALREAALRSKRSRVQGYCSVGDAAAPLPAPSIPVPVLSLPLPNVPVPSLPIAPLVVSSSSVSRFHRPIQDKTWLPRIGNQNFPRAPRSNLIVIQTVPLDEEKPVELKKPNASLSQEKVALVRPQDRWAPTDDVRQAVSPVRPKVPTKFDRYDGSDSDTDDDMSVADDSESDVQLSTKDYNAAVEEPDEGVDGPDTELEQIQRHLSPAEAVSEHENDAEPVSSNQLCEQFVLNSSTPTKSAPSASFQESSSVQCESRSECSSFCRDSPSREETRGYTRSRTRSKSPVLSQSPMSLRSLSRSSSRSTSCFDLEDRLSHASASPAKQMSPSVTLNRATSLHNSDCSLSNSPLSYVDRQSPLLQSFQGHTHSSDVKRNFKSQSRSPASFRSLCRSPSPGVRSGLKRQSQSSSSFEPSLHSRSGSRSRSPISLKSPRDMRSTSRSWSSTHSPLRPRSKTPSRSPLKTIKHSRSPNDHVTRTLSSSPKHSPSRLKSKNSSGLPLNKDGVKHLNSSSKLRPQKTAVSLGHGSAFHYSKSPDFVSSYESKNSALKSGRIRSKDISRSPRHIRDEKISPTLPDHSSTFYRSSRSPIKFKSFDSSWSPYSGQKSSYLETRGSIPHKLSSRYSSPDFERSKLLPARLSRSRSPRQRLSRSRSRSPRQKLSRSRSPTPHLVRSHSRMPRFSRSRSPSSRLSRTKSPSVSRPFSPGMPPEYKPTGISKSRNGGPSGSYHNQSLTPRDDRHSRDIARMSDSDQYQNRYMHSRRNYADSSELNHQKHYVKTRPYSQHRHMKESRQNTDYLERDSDDRKAFANKQLKCDNSTLDFISTEKKIVQKLGREITKDSIECHEAKPGIQKRKNYELQDHSPEEHLRDKKYADEQVLKYKTSASVRKRLSPAKIDVRSNLKDSRSAKESERKGSEKESMARTVVDSEIELSRSRHSICDDSDSESDVTSDRQKHYIERKDLGTRDPVLQKRNHDLLQNSGFKTDDKRFMEYNHDQIIREGTRQDYIPPLMDGLHFRNSTLSHQGPRQPKKRPRSKSPPIKSVLSIVKKAKDSDYAEAEAKKSKIQLPTEVEKKKFKASSQALERNYVDDETKKSKDISTVDGARNSSHTRTNAQDAKRNLHDKISRLEAPAGDQRTIQITFNQKMNIDGIKSSRPSVHERLGSFDINLASKDKELVKSGSSVSISEEMKYADLRDLLGKKSRNVAYDLGVGSGNKSGHGDSGNDLYVRHRNSKMNLQGKKFDNNSAGHSEGRQSGRTKYR